MSVPTPDTQQQALEVIRHPLDVTLSRTTFHQFETIIRHPEIVLQVKIQAAERCLELIEAVLTAGMVERETVEGVERAVDAVKMLPEEVWNGLTYALESARLKVKTVLQDIGITPEMPNFLSIGTILGPDSDAIFTLNPTEINTVITHMQDQHWEETIRIFGEFMRTYKSSTLNSVIVTTLKRLNWNEGNLVYLERFLSENGSRVDPASQLISIYTSHCESYGRSPLPSLKPSLSKELSNLIISTIQSQSTSSPKTPESIRNDIKRIADYCKVKDPNEVFVVLKNHFTQAKEPVEIQGCMCVLKAVQLSKNLNPGKVADLYNALHQKTNQSKTGKKKEIETKSRGSELQSKEEVSEEYMMEIPLFDPAVLPQILTAANANAYAVIQAYMSKRSEFMKCVELFRLLGNAIAEDLPGYTIHTFGSLSQGTWTKYSTVDITLFNSDVSDYVLPLNQLANSLKMHPDIKIDPVFKSKYPVLRVKRADSYFWVNITINNLMGLEISKLMNRYLGMDHRIPELVVYVKVWAHINGVNQSKLGYPSGYSWTLLVLHFLMSIGFLPCLQVKEHTPVYVGSCDVWVDEDTYEITDKRSLGQLVMLFFYHYGVAVPDMSCVLDMRTGRIDSIAPCPVLYPLIQPFEDTRPLFTLHKTKDSGRKVINSMRKAYLRLVRQTEVIRLN